MILLFSDLMIFPNTARSVTSKLVVISPEQCRDAKGKDLDSWQRRSLLPKAFQVCVC